MESKEISKKVEKIEDIRLAMRIYLEVEGDKERVDALIDILKTLPY